MKWDFIIFTPMVCREKIDQNKFHVKEGKNIFIDTMNQILEYEIYENVFKNIKRCFIGQYTLNFYKNWPEPHIEQLPSLNGDFFLTYEEVTGICICEIVANVKTDDYITFYLDSVPKNEIFIFDETENKQIKLCDFFDSLGFIQLSMPKSCVFLSETPPERKLTYILASEFLIENDGAFIDSQYLENKLKCNISQYDFLKCYATTDVVVNIMKDFPEDYSERIYYEGLVIFLVELNLLQIAAILRTNNRVVDILSKGDIPTLEAIKDINLQYAQTIIFWNINIFRSTNAQVAANLMYNAFEVPNIIEQYERNQKMMEHIISIKEQIQDIKHSDQQEEENNILGVLAALSILSAICDGFSNIDFFISFEETINKIQELSFISILSILLKIIFFIYLIIFCFPSMSVIHINRYKKRQKKTDDD